MRIHELAKKYNVSNDELIQLLQNAGYDISNRLGQVDYDMLAALERHFNWSAPAKKKAKTKKKAKASTREKVEAVTKTKVKAKLKSKARLRTRTKPEKETEETETTEAAEEKTTVKAKVKAKAKAKGKAKAKVKAKAKAKAKAAKTTKTKTRAKTATKTKTEAAEVEEAVAASVDTDPAVDTPPKPKTKRKSVLREKTLGEEARERAKEEERLKKLGLPVTSAVLDDKKPKLVKPAPKPAPPTREEPPKPAKPAKPEKEKKERAAAPKAGKKAGKKAAEPAKAEKKPKAGPKSGQRAEKKAGGPPRKQKGRKTPAEMEAQRKAVRESVRRTLAKLETTRKTKRRKPRSDEEISADQKPVQVQDKSSVALLADALEMPVDEILACCEEMGVAATATQELDKDVIELVSEALGRVVEIEAVYGEKRLLEEAQFDPARLKSRAPVVTIMGHVDHGKTSILDYIRHTRVVDGEAGGITQHIGAYKVTTPGGDITFIDTPGHEAFTAMRARGAQCTDIVVLVVAADDGVMPQTMEAINHTKASGVPMVVAVNKIDLAGANPANVKQQLSQHEVVVEEFGGDVVSAEVSAKTGDGIDKLLEMILLQSELLELKADPSARSQGVVVESKKEEGRGILCTVLVQQGTLEIGDVFVVGNEYGKVRSLLDDRGKKVKKAGPSNPVQVLGFNGVPQAGDMFIAVKNDREAREISVKRQEAMRTRDMQPAKPLTLEDLYAQIQQGEVKELNIIVKGDTNGSVEALNDSLSPMVLDEIKVKMVDASVGTVSESDVLFASTSNAVIIAFNANVAPKAKSLAKQKGIEIRRYNVIYEAIEDIYDAMKGMLEPEIVERVLGKAEVRKIFRASRMGLVAGSMVTEGTIERNANARVYRGDEVVFEGKIVSLKRFKDDVKEVSENFECGIGLSGFDTLQESDVIEAFVVEEKARVV
jgi:translation initiation factor IF-2